MISLTINGRDVQLANPMTIRQLLASKGLTPQIVVVEHNREIVPRERYDDVVVGADDDLEIVQMMAGG
jgi:thiamine biosynthesis protein ThiS